MAEHTLSEGSVHGSRSLAQWLAEYGESHQHPLNERLHWICVPLIALAAFGMIAAIPLPAALTQSLPGLQAGHLAALAVVLYYFNLSRSLALGSLVVLGLLLLGVHGLSFLPWSVMLSSVVIFVLAWIGQFVGHAYEGRRPSFFKDLQFLLIGPIWLLAALYRRLGLPY